MAWRGHSELDRPLVVSSGLQLIGGAYPNHGFFHSLILNQSLSK